MTGKIWAGGAAVTLLTFAGAASAAEPAFRVRLDDAKVIPASGISGNSGSTMTLQLNDSDSDADTVEVWGRRGWGWGGRGWGWGGGYRGWGWGGYRSWGWAGYSRPWGWGGWGYRPYVWGGGWGYPTYYYYPSYTYYYWPCAGDVAADVSPTIIYTQPNGNGNGANGNGANGSAAYARPNGNGSNGAYNPSPNGTYPYDGGPSNPVPMPKGTPAAPAPKTAPMEGRTVSIPAAPSKHTYPAYGERSGFAEDRVVRK